MADGSKMGLLRQLVALIDSTTGALKVTGGGSASTTGVGMRLYVRDAVTLTANTELSLITNAVSAAGAALTFGSADGWPAGKNYRITSLGIAMPHDANFRLRIRTRANGAATGMTSFNLLRSSGAGSDAFTPMALRRFGHPLFHLQRDIPATDTQTFGAGEFLLANRPGVELPFPNGGDVTVQNTSTTTDYVFSFQILAQEIVP